MKKLAAFALSICLLCGCILTAQACDHITTYDVTEVVIIQCTPNDENSHHIEEETKEVTYCSDCGEKIQSNTVNVRKEDEAHNLDGNGTCIKCGLTSSGDIECRHYDTSTRLELDHQDYTATDNGDGTHTRYIQNYYILHCGYCDEIIGQTEEDETLTNEAHWINYGKCFYCDAITCQHPNKYEVDSGYMYIDYQEYSSTQHWAIGTQDYYEYCPDCNWFSGATENGGITIVYKRELSRELQAHAYSGNQCTVCGYVNTCAHEHTDTQTNTYNTYEGDDLGSHTIYTHVETVTTCQDCGVELSRQAETQEGNTENCTKGVMIGTPHINESVVDNGDGTHTNTFDEYGIYECTVCHYYIKDMDNLQHKVITEPHQYYGGQCWCGNTNTCIHEHQEYQYEYQVWSSEVIDESTHKARYRQNRMLVCLDCNEMLDSGYTDEYYEATEAHTFDEYDDCIVCYYHRPCQHPNKYESELNREYVGVQDIDDEYHACIYHVQYREVCPDCGWMSELAERDVQELAKHDYLGQYCEGGCGHINPCTHENTRTDVYTDEIYEGDDQGHHIAYTYIYSETNCVDCGINLDAQAERQNERTENCTKGEWLGKNCADETVVDNGDGTHTYEGDYWDEYECILCHGIVPGTVHHEVVTEPHRYSGGQCWCGNINTCTHEHQEEQFDYQLWSSDYIDENTHKATYRQNRNLVCLDCNELLEWGYTDEYSEVIEAHTFDEYNCCTICNYVRPCQHPNAYQSALRVEDEVITDNNDGTHTRRGRYLNIYHCPDCDEHFDNDDWYEVDETVPHVYEYRFNENKCLVCEHECEHENQTLISTDNGEATYTDNGDGTHKKSWTATEQWKCSDCGMPSSRTEDKVENEEHTYENGICSLCSAIAPTPTPTVTPEPTPVPTEEPTPKPTNKPTAVPQQTTPTPEPTEEPTPEPTEEPTPEPEEETVKFVFEDVTEEVILHDLDVTEGIQAEQAITVIGDALDEEVEQKGAEITVIGAEQLFTVEENETIQSLPITEQLYVTFAALGMDEAITQLEEQISPEAANVREQVLNRIENMTDDDKTEFEEMLMTLFPIEMIEVDGVQQQYFVIDLKVVVDGEVRIERYGFRKAETGWILEKLYIGTEVREE